MSHTVISCEKAKEVNGKPVYKVGLSDGRFGESFANEIKAGTPVDDLVIEETQWGLKFKRKSSGNGAGGAGRPRAGNEAFALSYAKDYGVAMIAAGKEFKTDHVIALAEKFYTWMEGKKK